MVAADISPVRDRAIWDRHLAEVHFPHLPQSWAYGEGKRATGWHPQRVSFSIGGRVVALATVLERGVLGVPLVARVNRGPVFIDADPTPECIEAVYRALRRRWRGPLSIAPALPAGEESAALLRRAGYRRRDARPWTSGRLDLGRSEEDLWAGFEGTFRNRYRAAEKAGATLRVADDADTFEWMIARHLENMAEKGFSAVDATLLRALKGAAKPGDVLVFQLLHEGEAVAGMSVVRFGTHAEYHTGWFGQAGRKLNAGNFLMWHIIREMKRRGSVAYDVGGMSEGSGYSRFKRTMNPVQFSLAGEWVSLWPFT